METVKATITWDSGRFCLWAEPSDGKASIPEPFGDGDPLACLLLELDDDERETGRIAGVEIVGFLDFDRWEDLPKLSLLWQLPGWEALPLDDLLKRKQTELRERALAARRA